MLACALTLRISSAHSLPYSASDHCSSRGCVAPHWGGRGIRGWNGRGESESRGVGVVVRRFCLLLWLLSSVLVLVLVLVSLSASLLLLLSM
jgi:hypothetical protein